MPASAAKRKAKTEQDLPPTWDPPSEEERVYYRDIQTGDLGYMVRREGKACIRLDRPLQEIIRPYRKNQWKPDVEHRPLTKFQVTRIAFEADRQLCLTLGLHDKAKREWMSLTDEQRIAWSDGGPTDKVERVKLYRSVMKALSPFMQQR